MAQREERRVSRLRRAGGTRGGYRGGAPVLVGELDRGGVEARRERDEHGGAPPELAVARVRRAHEGIELEGVGEALGGRVEPLDAQAREGELRRGARRRDVPAQQHRLGVEERLVVERGPREAHATAAVRAPLAEPCPSRVQRLHLHRRRRQAALLRGSALANVKEHREYM